MYRWRDLTQEQRQEELARRKLGHRPKHSPSHYQAGKGVYLVTGTCYEHKPWIGVSDHRMSHFAKELIELTLKHVKAIDAWSLLPKHYHLLVDVESCAVLLKSLGQLYGRTAHAWNGEDDARGRKVWFNCLDRKIHTDGHHVAAINYVQHNPVKHGYVKKWDQWRWSSAAEYIAKLGREEVERRWNEYPILNFGSGWDV